MVLAWVLVLVVGALGLFCLGKARRAVPGVRRTLAWTFFALSAAAFALLAGLLVLASLSRS